MSVNKGCQVVPIGSAPNRDKEWRVSFSVAEEKLNYSMNYCRCQCYGLIFERSYLNNVNCLNFKGSCVVHGCF